MCSATARPASPSGASARRGMAGGMSAHYLQKFLDHADLKTTSRYLKIERRKRMRALPLRADASSHRLDGARCNASAYAISKRLAAIQMRVQGAHGRRQTGRPR